MHCSEFVKHRGGPSHDSSLFPSCEGSKNPLYLPCIYLALRKRACPPIVFVLVTTGPVFLMPKDCFFYRLRLFFLLLSFDVSTFAKSISLELSESCSAKGISCFVFASTARPSVTFIYSAGYSSLGGIEGLASV